MAGRAWWMLLVFVAVTAAAALAGSLATLDASHEYARLEQPAWAPPGWLFGPVWTTLYAGIAVSGWLLWRAGRRNSVVLWSVQLAVNAAWSPIFFAWEQRGLALAWILMLDVLVAVLIVRTWRTRWPAWLLVPYLAWIAFATALNAAVWWLNR